MNNKLKNIIVTAVFSAMIFVLTAVLHIPVASGYVHLGDALLYVCALMLDMTWALVAGALGEGLADVASGFAAYAPATVIIKVLIALCFTLIKKKSGKLLSAFSALMTVPAGVITVGGYFLADLVISREYAVVDIAGNAIQAVASAIIFIIIAAALDKIKIKDKIYKK
ncbi:MAG: ECF transporter S component [Eubacterium sp.]|nr:ECF transporter S component [Eubacterium sp.]